MVVIHSCLPKSCVDIEISGTKFMEPPTSFSRNAPAGLIAFPSLLIVNNNDPLVPR